MLNIKEKTARTVCKKLSCNYPATVLKPVEAWDIEKLLIWTYQNQAADAVLNRQGSGLPSAAPAGSAAAMVRYAELGCRVDGTGAGAAFMAAVGTDMHPDAEVVHEAVKMLGSALAIGLVISYAKAGSRPDCMADAVVRALPVYRGNGKPTIEYENNRASYCLVIYDPDPAHLEFVRATWVAWWDALALLVKRLDGQIGRKVLMPPFPRQPWLVKKGLDAAKKV